MTPTRGQPDDGLARDRYLTIKHTIPDRLDRIADQLTDCLDLLARNGLAEALPSGHGPQHVSVQGLRDAAARIRIAARHIPWTEIASRTETPRADLDPAHIRAEPS
jgi:hypothetical protein